ETSSVLSSSFFANPGKSLMSPAEKVAALFSWSIQPSNVEPSNKDFVIGEWSTAAATGADAGGGGGTGTTGATGAGAAGEAVGTALGISWASAWRGLRSGR